MENPERIVLRDVCKNGVERKLFDWFCPCQMGKFCITDIMITSESKRIW